MKTRKVLFGSLGLGDEFRTVKGGPIYVKAINPERLRRLGGSILGYRGLVNETFKRGFTRDSLEVIPVSWVLIYQDPISRMAPEGQAESVKTYPEPFKTLPESLTRFDVRFKGETRTVSRLVNSEDIRIGQAWNLPK